MELQNGRPETTSGRLDKEIRVYDLLDKLGIAYQRVDHEATMTWKPAKKLTVFWAMTLLYAKIFFSATGRRQTFTFF